MTWLGVLIGLGIVVIVWLGYELYRAPEMDEPKE